MEEEEEKGEEEKGKDGRKEQCFFHVVTQA